jgi:hypothetical protein
MAWVARGARQGGSDDSSIRIESRDLYTLTKQLQGVDRKLATAMKAEMRQVAEPIRARVADEASWSKRIPGATKVSTRFTARTQQVIITVNRAQAPHARPLENDGKEGFFTHPLPVKTARTRRGRLRQSLKSHTVKQRARPFFAKAIKSQDRRIDRAIEQVARNFERQAGFR